jgi:hypothetical protein
MGKALGKVLQVNWMWHEHVIIPGWNAFKASEVLAPNGLSG